MTSTFPALNVKNPVATAVTGRKLSIPQALELAIALTNRNELPQAELLLAKILKVQPRNSVALGLLSSIAGSVGRLELALTLNQKACDIQKSNPELLSNSCELHRRLGDLDSAISCGKRAVLADPTFPKAHTNLGIALLEARLFDEAKESLNRAVMLEPQNDSALNALGSLALSQGKFAEAIEFYRRALARDKNRVETLLNLSSALTQSGANVEAVAISLQAVKLQPKNPRVHSTLGFAFLSSDDLQKAELAFSNALNLKPEDLAIRKALIKVLQKQKYSSKALVHAQTALALSPLDTDVHCLLGQLYNELNEYEKSESAFGRALEIDPTYTLGHMVYGYFLLERGNQEGAAASFARALEISPNNLDAKLALAGLYKAGTDNEKIAAFLLEAQRLKSATPEETIYLNFELGKAFEKIKNYDAAFDHFKQGCKLKRSKINYSPDNNDLLIQNIEKVFTKDFIEKFSGCGHNSTVPIFILGMPRSGTTLTEQIIASHPLVHGAGEIRDLMWEANHPGGMLSPLGYPLSVRDITPELLSTTGENYVRSLLERKPDAKRITDKMPSNFNAIGLIHVMLPRAKIVHVNRHPLDTCLSCFTTHFATSQLQSYDLVELGRYYRNYLNLMGHWRETLPADAFYEVAYEDLVSDPERQVRSLLNYLELEWDQACLDFHKNSRSVKTASITQVRAPIYKNSINKWRHYEKQLQPLVDILNDFPKVV